MKHRLVISTQCPTCGATLEFAECSNALSCRYCQSNLLLTGRKRVLSYYVKPKIRKNAGIETVQFHPAWKGQVQTQNVQFYFIPFYRFTGHDVRWERPSSAPVVPVEDRYQSPLERAFASLNEELAVEARENGRELKDRYVDKSFPAVSFDASGVYSLGARLSTLRLQLFSREAVDPLGKIVAPRMSPEEAIEKGMRTSSESEIESRCVLGRFLSLIYFPFLVVPVKTDSTVAYALVDGVSGGTSGEKIGKDRLNNLRPSSELNLETIGFQPLVCPECGRDLPVRPDDAIFFCSSCEKCFQISGSELIPLSYEVARFKSESEHPNGDSGLCYMPFWVLRPPSERRLLRIPAFRVRRLKVLVDLAGRHSNGTGPFAKRDGPLPSLHPCYYDQQDAIHLAKLKYPDGGSIDPQASRSSGSPDSATLTWLPFNRGPQSLQDPVTGREFNQSLLV